jgi:HK97 family phage major capsid protein
MGAAQKMKELHAQKIDLVKQAEAALAANDETRFEEVKGRIEATNKAIGHAQFLLDQEMAQPVTADPERVAAEAAQAAGKPAFKSLGEQMQAVVHAANGRQDPRLFQAAALGQNETTPADGGFFVQHDFSSSILNRMYTTGSLLASVNRMSVQGNGLKLPAVDETSRANGSRFGGIQAYWESEAATATASQAKFNLVNLELKKVTGLVYVTEELLQDAPALGAFIAERVPMELRFKVEDAIVNGTGAGQPLGYMNAGCLVSVAKETSQVADTINRYNVAKMKSRLNMGGLTNAIWLCHQDATPQFDTLDFVNPAGTVGLAPINSVFSPSGVPGSVGSLYGRPVLATEYNATVGDQNDIAIIDPTQYVLIEKGGVQSASSMHVQFLTGQTAFRFTYRVDGQPTWHTALTPFKGSNTTSPFVVLDARA